MYEKLYWLDYPPIAINFLVLSAELSVCNEIQREVHTLDKC